MKDFIGQSFYYEINMKALILAAGLGSRLHHKTKEIPKAMVQINGKAIISHQIEALKKNNIHNIAVVLGYKASTLREYLVSHHHDIDFKFFNNDNYDRTNSAYSFFLASEYIIDESYIHLNCDVLFSYKLLQKLIESKKENILAVNFNDNLSNNMELVDIDQNNRIIYMTNRLFHNAKGKAYGLAKFSSKSSKYLIKSISTYHSQGDYNQNYYGIIREGVNHIDYFSLDSKNMLLCEINTLIDFNVINEMSI